MSMLDMLASLTKGGGGGSGGGQVIGLAGGDVADQYMDAPSLKGKPQGKGGKSDSNGGFFANLLDKLGVNHQVGKVVSDVAGAIRSNPPPKDTTPNGTTPPAVSSLSLPIIDSMTTALNSGNLIPPLPSNVGSPGFNSAFPSLNFLPPLK